MKSSISLKVVCCILNILTHHRSLPRPPAAKEQKQNCRRPLITHSLCPITSNSLPHAPSKKAYSVLSPTIYSLIIVHYPAPPAAKEQKQNCRRLLITHNLCPITSNSLPHAPSKEAYSVLSPTPLLLITSKYIHILRYCSAIPFPGMMLTLHANQCL